MSGSYSEIAATRIRGELDPSPELKEVLSHFFEAPPNLHSVKLHTTSHVLLDPRQYHGNEYHGLLNFIEDKLRQLAKVSFALAEPTHLRREGESGSLYFSVQNRGELAKVENELKRLSGELETSFLPTMLCFKVARGALVRDAQQLADAKANMAAALSQPDTQRTMTASGLRLVIRDLLY